MARDPAVMVAVGHLAKRRHRRLCFIDRQPTIAIAVINPHCPLLERRVVLAMLDGWACRYKILPNGLRQITAFMLPGDSCNVHIGGGAPASNASPT